MKRIFFLPSILFFSIVCDSQVPSEPETPDLTANQTSQPVPTKPLPASCIYEAINQGNITAVKFALQSGVSLNDLRADTTPLMEAVHELGKEMLLSKNKGFKSPFYPLLATSVLLYAYGLGCRDQMEDSSDDLMPFVFGVATKDLSSALKQLVSKSGAACLIFWLIPNILYNGKVAVQWAGYKFLKDDTAKMPRILGYYACVHERTKIVELMIKDSRLNPMVTNSKGETAISLLEFYRNKISSPDYVSILYRLEHLLLDKSDKKIT
jgi:hypothetical protein